MGEHPDDHIDGSVAALWKLTENWLGWSNYARGAVCDAGLRSRCCASTPDVFNDGVILSTLATASMIAGQHAAREADKVHEQLNKPGDAIVKAAKDAAAAA